jgi:hypothetical protein
MSPSRGRSTASRQSILPAVGLVLFLLPGSVLGATAHGPIDTDFAVTIDQFTVTLTATAGKDGRETGSFAIYQGSSIMVEGEYDVVRGQVVTFGPYTLPAASYRLVWDNEPGHDPGQSHRELAFDVVAPQPTATPTGGVLPTSGVNPTEAPDVTLPPTDAVLGATPETNQPVLWVVFLIGLLVGIALLTTPRTGRRGR